MNDIREQIEWIRTRRSRDIDHDIADSLENLLAVAIEAKGLIGAFEDELREVVGHTNVHCLKEKLAALDSVQTRRDLPDLDPTGELKKQDDYYAELHGDSTADSRRDGIAEGNAALEAAGLAPDSVGEGQCPKCGGSGWVGGYNCECAIKSETVEQGPHK